MKEYIRKIIFKLMTQIIKIEKEHKSKNIYRSCERGEWKLALSFETVQSGEVIKEIRC